MILFSLLNSYLAIYVGAAVIPAIILLVYVYKKDMAEKEPIGLILSLLVRGVLAALLAGFLETIMRRVLPAFVSQDDPNYIIFFAFIAVAMVEEGTKLFFLYRRTWYDPNFNYSFDGIVYAVTVSLGFAAFENIGYVFNYGLTVAPTRAVLAIPGHMSFAVFMGFFYGRAKRAYDRDWNLGSIKYRFFLVMGYASAVFLHGFYDSCAMIGTDRAMTVFVIFVIIMFFIAFSLIKREAKHDRRV